MLPNLAFDPGPHSCYFPSDLSLFQFSRLPRSCACCGSGQLAR
jgi:hypothetical protein